MIAGYHRTHEASVPVSHDSGRPLFAAAEERFSRIKMQGGWPRLTAERVAKMYGLRGARTIVTTSFNMHEEPFVCGPDEAVRNFLQGNLDHVALGPFDLENPHLGPVVARPPQRGAA